MLTIHGGSDCASWPMREVHCRMISCPLLPVQEPLRREGEGCQNLNDINTVCHGLWTWIKITHNGLGNEPSKVLGRRIRRMGKTCQPQQVSKKPWHLSTCSAASDDRLHETGCFRQLSTPVRYGNWAPGATAGFHCSVGARALLPFSCAVRRLLLLPRMHWLLVECWCFSCLKVHYTRWTWRGLLWNTTVARSHYESMSDRRRWQIKHVKISVRSLVGSTSEAATSPGNALYIDLPYFNASKCHQFAKKDPLKSAQIERRIQLAISNLKNGRISTIHKAIRIYNISHTTL